MNTWNWFIALISRLFDLHPPSPLEKYYDEDDGEDDYLDGLDHYMEYGDKE